MRIDVLTIFPDYLAPLELSLAGKARDKGLIDIRVHDLRDWTHDRHRTVDDTPYGGGAGMVMKPEPWGEAFDELLDVGRARPSSSRRRRGSRSPRRVARELATKERLVFACGRYEGIDQRVIDEVADPGRGPRDLARRLRAQRGRGGRAGDHRGRRAPGAGLHGQRRVAGRGVPRGRAARVPRLHQARVVARPRRAAGAAVGRPRRDRGLAARPGASGVRRSGGPTSLHAVRAARRRRDPRRPSRPTRASCYVLQLRLLGRRSSTTTPACGSRRCTRRSTTCAPGWPATPCWSRGRRAGWSARCAASLRRRRLGGRPADGRPRPAGPRPRPRAAGADRGAGAGRRRRRTRCSPARAACATSGCTRRPATGCAARSRPAWCG